MTIRENVYSTNGWNLLSTLLCYEVMALLASSPIVLAATWGIMRHTVFVFAGVFAVTLPICLLLAWSHNRYVQKRSGFVELDDDTLHYFENENEPPVHSAPFEDCLWFEGYRTWATLPRQDKVALFQIAIGPQVLLLQFPEWLRVPEHKIGKGATIAAQPVIIPVGQSPETREQWAFVLEHMGIKCDALRHRRLLAPISSGLATCWMIFCGIASFLVLSWSSSRITNVLSNLNVPKDVAGGIGFSSFMPGIIFLLLWICIFPLLWIDCQTVQKVKMTSQFVLRLTLPLAVLPFLLWTGNKTFEWNLTIMISSVVMFLVTVVGYWLLVRPSKHKKSEHEA